MRCKLLFFFTGFLMVSVSAGLRAAELRPNILLITSDDQGKFYAGCYGNDTIHTPALDGLAREGLRLNHCMTVSAICVPSRAALMTGEYPFTSGAYGFYPCRPDIKPLSSILAENGY